MNRKEQNIAVFEDTMDWIEHKPALSDAAQNSITHTVLYPAQQMPDLPEISNRSKTKVTVTPQRTFEAAQDLLIRNPGSRAAVLNFASATNPGGGVTRGSSAQEEALCRCSTLYPCLTTTELDKGYYQYHRKQQDVRYTDACIYVPDIKIIKTDTDSPKRLPETRWQTVDVICCAAPNLRERPYNKMNPGQGKAIRVTPEELLGLHRRRAYKILSVAAANNVECLVLGAFGCGAFRNDPNIVARAYRDIFPEFDGYFREIRFAVYCLPHDRTNFDVFRRLL